MQKNLLAWGAVAVLALGTWAPTLARPGYLAAFKTLYKTKGSKPNLDKANCALCHVGVPNTGNWNAYGNAIRAALKGAVNEKDAKKVNAALKAAGKAQNTGRGMTFVQLINQDMFPAQGAGDGKAAKGAKGGKAAGGAPISGTWEPLFNGVNSTGWTQVGQGNWSVQDGILKYTGGGNGWMRSTRQFTNYSMVVVWRFTQAGNANDSGVILKLAQGGPAGSPQLNIGPGTNFGSISNTQGSRPRGDLIRANDWNTYQLTVQNGGATLAINNQVAWPLATGASLNGAGSIALEGAGRGVEFAQVWIMPLP
jgi:hypothetical protein